MKTLIVSLALFIIMISAVCINYFYINKVADSLLIMTSEIPSAKSDGCYSAVSQLDDFWQKNHNIVGLSVSFVELNRISDGITSMKAYALTTEDAEFESSRRVLLNAIHEMRRLEAFTIGNILFIYPITEYQIITG